MGKVIKFHDADGLISSCFKQFAPPAAYDYHQPLPTPDPEAPEQDFGNCSICMEPIIVSQLASGSGDKHIHTDESSVPSIAAVSGVGHVGSKVMNMNLRRTYALAPCHHLFHTECLSQWLSIKVCSAEIAMDLLLTDSAILVHLSAMQTPLACTLD